MRPYIGAPWAADLLQDLPDLPFASGVGRDPIVACLDDLRDRYLGESGLRGTLRVERDVAGVNAAESPLRSVLEHLVEGALRDNPSKNPFCHVGVATTDEAEITLYLRDNGAALPEATIDELRKFVQETRPAHVPNRVYRLFLAEALVQWLGGRLWLGPSPNGSGSTVFLRLPRSASAGPPRNVLLGRHVF